MRRETVTGLAVCHDCANAAANGLREAAHTAPRWHRFAYLGAARRNPDSVLVVTCCAAEDCAGFSMSRCDWCGSRYGGDRHAAALLSIH